MTVANVNSINNDIIDTNKVFGDAPAAYAELVDLGTDRNYYKMIAVSTLDKPITLKLESGRELIVEANQTITLDSFLHNDVIQWKHNGVAPLSGSFKLINY